MTLNAVIRAIPQSNVWKELFRNNNINHILKFYLTV
jgi:hypothetical protein